MRPSGKGKLRFIRYRHADNDHPLLVKTSAFTSKHGPMVHKDESVSFGLTREDAPGLHELVTLVEEQVHNHLLYKTIPELPEAVSEEIRVWGKDDKLVRSQAGGKRVFVQPSADCVTYSWDGTKTLPNEWGSGRYQFVLRLSNIFAGKGTKYGFYIQWKIAQIRYEAYDFAVYSLTRDFLFGEKQQQQSTPALPKPQKRSALATTTTTTIKPKKCKLTKQKEVRN